MQMLEYLSCGAALFKSLAAGKTPNNFIAYLCTIAWETYGVYGTGLYMPSPAERLDAGGGSETQRSVLPTG